MTGSTSPTRQPALFLSHGAPPLVDSPTWVQQLKTLARGLGRPTAILIVSAHWEAAPLTIGSTDSRTPLTYDFGGFPEKYYRVQYRSPGAPDLARRVAAMMPDGEPIAHDPTRRLDHGAYVPMTVMYPEADIPVLQISLPTLDPERLLELGRRLKPLRDEGVLVIGSGFTTHGLPFLRDWRPEATPPSWSAEFDAWAAERFTAGDVESLIRFRQTAPGMPYAHPTVEHFAPLFVAFGASDDAEQRPDQVIDGFWMGLSKRSLVLA
ncbi:dioxygenase [Gordonia amicalis]|uniref:Class III extradiol ring-cleavage dioxygenase n=1 Tax=Gordonia amicalis TaxID=89053 RepID=A0AAE4R3D4_9ACTN|nr:MULTISPECIES: class III extradiol ring-cleavage dioxygenase [Gordonia]MCZ4578252.1 class III extradiol ring-cleavage dioxygenase [Gordonia amicalis]MDV6306860.1 class III extradiol ring-cleavage dioxygenase [Gordonia amicalis]MDV6311052.1 class III extradiol ring-cleavage dioxygenase [Gordonia amicalis]MDV7099174.1 class III extradiol ring-cleavage dioxygenase [Gordonia amicalis]UKO93681.1 dioxygenase [Gordonia amicalis]